jgi:hypothetical protein
MGHAVFLPEVGTDPLGLSDEWIVLDERVIVQDEVTGEGGKVREAGQQTEKDVGPQCTPHVSTRSCHGGSSSAGLRLQPNSNIEYRNSKQIQSTNAPGFKTQTGRAMVLVI